jgi:hypothetical protein
MTKGELLLEIKRLLQLPRPPHIAAQIPKLVDVSFEEFGYSLGMTAFRQIMADVVTDKSEEHMYITTCSGIAGMLKMYFEANNLPMPPPYKPKTNTEGQG